MLDRLCVHAIANRSEKADCLKIFALVISDPDNTT